MADFGSSNTALLVIDMQNDFLLPDAPMRVDGGAAVIPLVQKSVKWARQEGIHVVWVIREHDRQGHDVERFRKHFYENGPGATVVGTPGAALVDGLEVLDGDSTVVKKRFSAFFGTQLDKRLRNLGVTNIVISGVQTPNCIRQTAFDAVAYDFEVVVVLSDATGAATPEVHEANLFDMRKVGIQTPTVEEWISS